MSYKGYTTFDTELRKTETPLIPRKILFGNPDKTSLQVSPDGKYLSFIAPAGGVLNVWVAPIDDSASATVVTHDTSRGISIYSWAYAPNFILYLQDKEGDENYQIHAVNIETGEERNLTPFEEILGSDGQPLILPNGKRMRPTAWIQHKSCDFPDEILIGLNKRNPEYHDVFRVNIQTGKMQLVQENLGFSGFVTDDCYRVRFGQRFNADGGKEVFEHSDDNSWTSFLCVPMDDVLTTNLIGLDRRGGVLFLLDSRGRDKAALMRIDLHSGTSEILAEDSKADVRGWMSHPTTKNIQAVTTNYSRIQWHILDASIQSDMDYLQSLSDGELSVLDRSENDQWWALLYTRDDGPGSYYLYDRNIKKATMLFVDRQAIEDVPLAQMCPVCITSRDGLSLVSYLSLPAWIDADEGKSLKEPLPMVLLVHGGPWVRDSWRYNSRHQWLTNRGYAVLSVNYRGSTGFGKEFVNAANQEWAGKMHDDLADAVQWAVTRGIADEQRIAIMGNSYGGYATLVGLTFTPDIFACGIDLVGISNLQTLLESVPPYWKPQIAKWVTRVGDFRTDDGRQFLQSRSPLHKVERITKPLLIGHGVNDARVKQRESDQIVQAMLDRNIPVTYLLYSDEGHGLLRPENGISFCAVAEQFLAEHLGGRSEAIGSDFENSTIEVKTGANHISGLSNAIH